VLSTIHPTCDGFVMNHVQIKRPKAHFIMISDLTRTLNTHSIDHFDLTTCSCKHQLSENLKHGLFSYSLDLNIDSLRRGADRGHDVVEPDRVLLLSI